MIDHERLKLLVIGDIAEDLRDNYDIDMIIKNAKIEDGMIFVDLGDNSGVFYDPVTYLQLGGGGGIKPSLNEEKGEGIQ